MGQADPTLPRTGTDCVTTVLSDGATGPTVNELINALESTCPPYLHC